MSERHDMIVIGGGPGGYVAAIRASQLGMRTVLVERDQIGGRCLNYACIPAKSVLRSADVLDEVLAAASYGILVGEAPTVDFPAVAKRRDRVVKTLTGGVRGLLKKHRVEVLAGHGSLSGADASGVRVAVESAGPLQQLEAGAVVLATGSLARPLLGLEFAGRVLDTTGAWLLNQQPRTLAVIGAGASGVEIASAYGRLGTKVLLIEALPQILPAEEPEIAAFVAKELAKQNVDVRTSARIESVEPGANSVAIAFADERIEVEVLAIAAGRAPDAAALGLAAAGVELDQRGLIAVDQFLRSSAPNVYAVGDLVAGPALAHKASEEGLLAVEAAAGRTAGLRPIAHLDIPRATFCSPQVASFGLTEIQAEKLGRQVKIGSFPLAGAGAATVYGNRGGVVKVISDAATGELLGGHIAGAKAADMIEELVVAKSAQIGIQELARIVHPHPTFSEAVLEAARAADGWVIHA